MLLTENTNQYIAFLVKQMLFEKGDTLNVAKRYDN